MPGKEKATALSLQRESMIASQLRARDITDERVLTVMAELPRELFLDEPLRSQAYTDGPLPIGQGQTISQPYIQALMTQHLRLNGTERVLEIGTGSGYQTAILSRLSREVVTVERLAELSTAARSVLDALGLDNVRYIVADGSEGANQAAPFEAILVTAACPKVPEPLIEQLSDIGRLVAPVGPRETQDLILVTRQGDQVKRETICACRFVPLLGKHAF